MYYAPTGEMIHGECNIDGKWYYFNKYTGNMTTGWVDLPEKKVYYALSGEMLYGKQIIDGKEYHFDPITGALIKPVSYTHLGLSGWLSRTGIVGKFVKKVF